MRGLDIATPENAEAIKYCQQALERSSLSEDMILYRGTGIAEIGDIANLPVEDMVGKSFTEKAFTSTSVNDSVASGTFSGTLHLEIHAPKGSSALDIASLSQFNEEQEILFNVGQKFEIISAEKKGKVLYLVVNAIK